MKLFSQAHLEVPFFHFVMKLINFQEHQFSLYKTLLHDRQIDI